MKGLKADDISALSPQDLNVPFEPKLNLEYLSYLENEELDTDEIVSLNFI